MASRSWDMWEGAGTDWKVAKSTWPVLGAGTLFGLNGESLKDFPYMSDTVRSTF